MTAWLTKGMFGKTEELICESDDISAVWTALSEWKAANAGRIKTEPYDKITYDPRVEAVTVDFGNWSRFFTITGVSEPQFEAFTRREEDT